MEAQTSFRGGASFTRFDASIAVSKERVQPVLHPVKLDLTLAQRVLPVVVLGAQHCDLLKQILLLRLAATRNQQESH